MNRLHIYWLRFRKRFYWLFLAHWPVGGRLWQRPYTIRCTYGHTIHRTENATFIEPITILCRPEDKKKVEELVDVYLKWSLNGGRLKE